MDFTIGHILVTALDFPPPGTLTCNGQLVSVSEKRDLFDLLGTTYGGDGVSTFGLPNIPATHTGGPTGPTLSYCIVAEGAPYKSGMEALLGEVRLFPVPPPGGSTLALTWLPCDGRLLALTHDREVEALYSLLGTTYGGDGITTFAVPKIAPIFIANGPPLPFWICVSGIYPSATGDSVTPIYSIPQTYDTYIGTVVLLSYASSAADHLSGAARMRGQILPAASPWLPLYTLLGNRFGGTVNATFALPALASDPNTLPSVLVYEGLYPNR